MSTELSSPMDIKKAKKLIYIVSIAVPLVVAILFGVKVEGVDLSFLPPIYATINGLTALLLVGALVAIERRNMKLHRLLIRVSLTFSLLFLLCYVAYHMTSEPTAYEGSAPYIYYPLLIAHIVLSVAVIPLVLFTYLWAWQGDFKKHKKWTRFAWPIWMFVAVSGVIVYLMISPYYA